MPELELDALLYREKSPLQWSTIGSMEDLSAASHDDVQQFPFRTPTPRRERELLIAGDIDFDKTRALVERWFSDVPRARHVAPRPRRGDAHQVDAKDHERPGTARPAVSGGLTPGA